MAPFLAAKCVIAGVYTNGGKGNRPLTRALSKREREIDAPSANLRTQFAPTMVAPNKVFSPGVAALVRAPLPEPARNLLQI